MTLAAEENVKIRFRPKKERDFATVLKERVEGYFKEKGISRHADWRMYLKTAVHFFVFAGLYALLLSGMLGMPAVLPVWMGLGVMHALVGFNIAHDALHSGYSPSSSVNKVLGYAFDFAGLSSVVWKITHNFRHHIYTNIPGVDHDIEQNIFLRFSYKHPLRSFHRYQHLYAFFFYCFTGINWIFYSDYAWFLSERKKRRTPWWETALFFFFKALNFTLFFVIPMIVLAVPWWQVVVGYLALQFAGGFTSAIVFQLAHMVEGVEYPEPDVGGMMENQWAVHEMLTTANFGTRNPFLNWICGGLNFQIEHHLFPYVCHVHYSALSPIVRETAQEFGLPYRENPSFTAAVRSHLRHLKNLGANQGI